MKEDNKIYITNIAEEITNKFIEEEVKSFELFSSAYLDEILSEKADTISEHSHFGVEEGLVSYYLLAILAWISKRLAEEGIMLTKHALYDWVITNKPKIEEKSKNQKYLKALEILEKYLEKEVDAK